MIPRHLASTIATSLKSFPVVFLAGARQVGKSTLAKALARSAWRAKYHTLDDRMTLDAALGDPDGFVESNPSPLVLDEVQRAPDLMRAIKLAVDTRRRSGQYLLTGSANVLTLPAITEHLAGRMILHELHPFSWPESRRRPPSNMLKRLFETRDAKDLLNSGAMKPLPNERARVRDVILSGGLPVPALMRSREESRKWFMSYVQTYLERDLRNISALEHLTEFSRLLNVLAARTAQLVNLANISQELGLPLTTLRRYVNLLLTTYQVFFLHPYHAGVGKRLVKTPKLYFTDTGLAGHLGFIDRWEDAERQGRAGALVETWVATELRKLISVLDARMRLCFWRTHAGQEVNFLVERGGEMVAVEVKWARSIAAADIAGLEGCAELLRGRLRFSVLLYPGAECIALSPRIVALPFSVFFGVGR